MQADSQVVNNVCPHPSLPMVVTSGIDDCMRVWEGGDGRHLIDLPERYPDDDDDDDFDDDDYDDLDEMDAWGEDGNTSRASSRTRATRRSPLPTTRTRRTSPITSTTRRRRGMGKRRKRRSRLGRSREPRRLGQSRMSDDRVRRGTTSARAPSRARRNRGRSPDASA